MIRAGLHGEDHEQTNDTSNLSDATFEDHDILEDTELNAVTGGILTFCNSDHDILTTASSSNGHVK
jgi:hypothetical protein